MTDAARFDQGLLCAPTGSGKTVLGLELIRRQGQRALVLVHQNELAKQWRSEIEKKLGITAGMVGAGKWQEGEQITVATLQTLARHPQRTREMAQGYGLVLVDECHHVPAQSFAKVLGLMPCRYRYGLTATPHRRDGLHVLINRVIGRTLATIPQGKVEDVGGIVSASVQVMHTGFDPGRLDSWNEFLGRLTRNPERNQLIADLAEHHAATAPTLVLTDRIEHAEAIADACSTRPLVAHGQLSTKQRREAFASIPSANLTVGTTSLLGEGLDVAGWATLILASPISSRVRLLQAVGRVIRPSQGKTQGQIIDLVDTCGFGIASHRKRLVIYRERGYPVTEQALEAAA